MAEHPLVTISVISYNDERTIEACVKSAALQLHPRVEVIVVINASKDASPDLLKGLRDRLPGLRAAHLAANGVQNELFRYHILEPKENLGFARGHNRALASSQGEYFLMLNSDAGLDDRFVPEALAVFAKEPKLAAVQGKLYRYDFDEHKHYLDAATGKPLLDTTGLVVFKNRRIVNRGQGAPDTGQYDEACEMFGADGAAPFYRREALMDVAVPIGNGRTEVLDEDFFMYKEDVDLAWRLRLAGWVTRYLPQCICYHQRTSGESAAVSYTHILGERRKLSALAKYYAFRNQRCMQVKNEFPSLLFAHIPYWLPKELASWLWVLVAERYTWKAIGSFMALLPRMLKKRRIIMASRRATPADLAKWFV